MEGSIPRLPQVLQKFCTKRYGSKIAIFCSDMTLVQLEISRLAKALTLTLVRKQFVSQREDSITHSVFITTNELIQCIHSTLHQLPRYLGHHFPFCAPA